MLAPALQVELALEAGLAEVGRKDSAASRAAQRVVSGRVVRLLGSRGCRPGPEGSSVSLCLLLPSSRASAPSNQPLEGG